MAPVGFPTGVFHTNTETMNCEHCNREMIAVTSDPTPPHWCPECGSLETDARFEIPLRSRAVFTGNNEHPVRQVVKRDHASTFLIEEIEYAGLAQCGTLEPAATGKTTDGTKWVLMIATTAPIVVLVLGEPPAGSRYFRVHLLYWLEQFLPQVMT